MTDANTRHDHWRSLLADARQSDHIVQVYQDDGFLAEAVSHFAAEGAVRGEAVILVPTAPHWKKIAARLSAKGQDPDELIGRGQLTVLDADVTMQLLMDGSMPNDKVFTSLAGEAIVKARAGGKYPRVRWWGEIVNTLYLAGNRKASNRIQELFTEVAQAHSTPIFCSFLMDKFDPGIYDDDFCAVCRNHTHVIPADDYFQYGLAVNRAIAEVLGATEGRLLGSLLKWEGPATSMPASQALLLWVKDTAPYRFRQVLLRARECERELASHAASANGGDTH